MTAAEPADPAGLGRVLVVIPTYNERENLPLIVGRVRDAVASAHILVADDASPDGTGQVAEHLATDDDHVHVLHRPGKQGLGAAYLDAFGWGLKHGFDVLVEMDADGSHRPEDLPRLLERLAAGADLVLGSRWVPGGKVVNWPVSRLLISRIGNTYVRLVLSLGLRDATGGYRAFRRNTLLDLGLGQVASQGYCFQVDLARRAVQGGFRVEEVPITFVEREIGTSKMSRAIVIEALWRVTQWGARERWDQITGHSRRRRRAAEAARADRPSASRTEGGREVAP
ncbi:MAG TPA: polyprenol monophosphomannose synthase [Kineosporiaceae bacterium]|nr:polyprenol monophosphomannose synthase [Kineosporiaceae bacterium]